MGQFLITSFEKTSTYEYSLTGGKWSLREGGIRVPFVVRGPGINAGDQCDVPVSGIDILPTLFELAGGEQLETVQMMDGVSLHLC